MTENQEDLFLCRLCGQQVRDSHLREHFMSYHREIWLGAFRRVEAQKA
ncbi:MAG: hypothetical protein ACRDF4_03890 [Rhabdochlamydiaceae bacterium]